MALAAARTRATEALNHGSKSPHAITQISKWYAVGDPQTTFTRFSTALKHLIGEDGWLKPTIGLVSMGDHFDFLSPKKDDPEGRAAAGLEGQLILAWLAAHPPEQVPIILGNHDACRVIELSHVDDPEFIAARTKSYEENVDEWKLAKKLGIPNAGMLRKDFSCFAQAQRNQVQKLLMEGRYRFSLVAEHDNEPLLMVHAGFTARELKILGLKEEGLTPQQVHDQLEAFLVKAVSAVADTWKAGGKAKLKLDPLHVTPEPGREAGGFMAHRPSNRGNRPVTSWEFNPECPRRYHVLDIPRSFNQAVGHTGKAILERELKPWCSKVEFGGGACHTLHVGEPEPVLERGIQAKKGDATRLFLLDPGFAYLDSDEEPVELLEINGKVNPL